MIRPLRAISLFLLIILLVLLPTNVLAQLQL